MGNASLPKLTVAKILPMENVSTLKTHRPFNVV